MISESVYLARSKCVLTHCQTLNSSCRHFLIKNMTSHSTHHSGLPRRHWHPPIPIIVQNSHNPSYSNARTFDSLARCLAHERRSERWRECQMHYLGPDSLQNNKKQEDDEYIRLSVYLNTGRRKRKSNSSNHQIHKIATPQAPRALRGSPPALRCTPRHMRNRSFRVLLFVGLPRVLKSFVGLPFIGPIQDLHRPRRIIIQ